MNFEDYYCAIQTMTLNVDKDRPNDGISLYSVMSTNTIVSLADDELCDSNSMLKLNKSPVRSSYYTTVTQKDIKATLAVEYLL